MIIMIIIIVILIILTMIIGLPLEMTQSSFRVMLVYISGLLAASLGSLCFEPRYPLVGSSGGVYALVAAHLASLILNWNEDSLILRRSLRFESR